ncbi:MAG: hypothetical protein KAX57_07505, partial [Rhodoferax sp.]|nr:hypothetical protein [Rhodoferax sp.]
MTSIIAKMGRHKDETGRLEAEVMPGLSQARRFYSLCGIVRLTCPSQGWLGRSGPQGQNSGGESAT